MVISASWIRRHDGTAEELNLRGVSTILALAKYLKGLSEVRVAGAGVLTRFLRLLLVGEGPRLRG